MTPTELKTKAQSIIDLATEIRDATIEPDAPPPLAVSIEGPSEVTVGQTVTYTAKVAGGVPPYTYDWATSESGSVGDMQTLTWSWDTVGLKQIDVIVWDHGTLSVADKVFVTVKGIPQPPVGTSVNVGPSGAFQELHKVPFHNLQPNTVVNVVYRGTPYRSKIVLNRNDVEVKAVDAPVGQRVEINALDAVENAGALSFSSQITRNGIFTVVKPNSADFPKNVKVNGFKLTGARRSAMFTDKNGSRVSYSPGAGGVSVYTSDGVQVINCEITDNENGIFAKSDDSWGIVRNLLVSGNHVYGNGCPPLPGDPDAIYHYHNIYCESDGATYEFNKVEHLVPFSAGCLIKDRSAGAIVRFNELTGSVRPLDLVDPDNGEFTLKASPKWGKQFVYGNIIRNVMDTSVVNFGFDEDANNTQLELYFYFNTLVNTGDQWKFNWFKVNGLSKQKVFAGNNIFWNNSTDQARFYGGAVGTYFHVMGNFVSSGTIITADSNGNPIPVGLDGWNQQKFGTDPGLNADLTLKPESVCKGIAVWPTGWPIQLPTHGWNGTSWVSRTDFTAAGAAA
jgi:hypothetical protein